MVGGGRGRGGARGGARGARAAQLADARPHGGGVVGVAPLTQDLAAEARELEATLAAHVHALAQAHPPKRGSKSCPKPAIFCWCGAVCR